MRLASVYENQKAFEKAEHSYEAALGINSELTSATVKIAQLNLGPLQNKEKAFEFGKRARGLAPSDPQVAAILGRAVCQLGNFSWAYSLLQESLRQTPNDPRVLEDYAWALYGLGKVAQSQETMRSVLRAHPQPAEAEEASSFLAMTNLQQNPEHLAASEHEILKVLAADPGNVPALLAKAGLTVQRGDPDSAIAIYNELLRRFPELPFAQRDLAIAYLQDPGRVDEAYTLALKARNMLPEDTQLGNALGEISYKRQDFSYAIQCFQDTARRERLPARYLYYLGMAQLRLSQDSEGRKSLEKAISGGLQEPMLREARGVVADLQKRAGL